MTDKLQYLKDMQVSELSELLKNLLPSMEIEEVMKENESSVTGSIHTVAGAIRSYYHCVDHKLLKNDDTELVASALNKKIGEGYMKVYLVCTSTISGGYRRALEGKLQSKNIVTFWDIDDILEKIDLYYSDYWRHTDQALLAYERRFEDMIKDSFQIKKLIEFKTAYQKLISIFVEPHLYLRTTDKQTSRRAFTKINLEKVIDENKSILLLHGDPGTGKTRLLNEIGRKVVSRNATAQGKHRIPVFIDSISIRNAFVNDKICLLTLVYEDRLKEDFSDLTKEQILEHYDLIILIDSIDEFDEIYQKKIKNEIQKLLDKNIIIFIGTRSSTLEFLTNGSTIPTKADVFIQKFNDEQLEKFTSRYFEGQGDRAVGLINSLRENKIIDKLPLTPLNISLMSILYEETDNHEIPATLNDIYDKFSNLLLGRTMIDKSIDFLDITIKENILRTYALELLEKPNRTPMEKEEFIEFFNGKLKSISGTIKLEQIPAALNYIIEHTGLLTLHNGKYVKFRHDSYMEYFAAKEIFYNRRDLEAQLVDNFFDVNWQFAAVFYGGMSRHMPVFLDNVTNKIKTASSMREYWSSANGMGYLLQVLYLTDDEKRKQGVLETLKIMVRTYEGFKQVSATLPDTVFVSKISMPMLTIFPFFLFMDNFDSVTLRQPLSLALDDLLAELDEKEEAHNYEYLDALKYRILILAVTISSERLLMEDRLLEVIDRVKTIGNEFYTAILEIAIDNLGSTNLRTRKQELLRPYKIRKSDSDKNSYFLKNKLDVLMQPAKRYRFSKYDRINSDQKVKLLVEGPTDAKIIDHAYYVLTGGRFPYWEIRVGGGSEKHGGARQLAQALYDGLAFMDEEHLVIGIFDNDRSGIPEFKGGLKAAKFDLLPETNRIKRNKEGNIYAMLLPVPHHLQYYIMDDEQSNYFAIEHLLPNELLQKENMLQPTPIPDIFGIRESNGAKNSFATDLLKIKDPKVFENFIPLLKQIDEITGEEISYIGE